MGKPGFVKRKFLIHYYFQLKNALLIAMIGVLTSGIAGAGAYSLYKSRDNSLEKLLVAQSFLASEINEFVNLLEDPKRSAELSSVKLETLKSAKSDFEKRFNIVTGEMRSELSLFGNLPFYLLGVYLLIGGLLFITGIIITHRIAGPVHVLSSYMDSLEKGKLPSFRPIRKNDELKDFCERFEKVIKQISKDTIKQI